MSRWQKKKVKALNAACGHPTNDPSGICASCKIDRGWQEQARRKKKEA
jgi:hypothetical protein